MTSEIKIQIKFKIEENGYSFSDALYLTLEQYQTYTQEQIEVLQRERFDAWMDAINNPPVIDQPTEEQLAADGLKIIKDAIATDEPIINSVLNTAIAVAPSVSGREELRAALLALGE